jgi:hypothetical protein
MFKLDRTAFRIQTVEEADDTSAFWQTQTPQERLAAAWYLSCAAYNVDIHIRMDKSKFSMRKRKASKHKS